MAFRSDYINNPVGVVQNFQLTGFCPQLCNTDKINWLDNTVWHFLHLLRDNADSHHRQAAENSQTLNKDYCGINVSPRFEWQTATSQSAREDETHHFFDQQFYPTVQSSFLSMNTRSVKGPGWSHEWVRKTFPTRAAKRLSDLTSYVSGWSTPLFLSLSLANLCMFSVTFSFFQCTENKSRILPPKIIWNNFSWLFFNC